MDEFSKLTLELFMNKNAYNRYIEKTDPNKYQEHQDYIIKGQKYKSRILDITRRFIENPDLQITSEMNDMFSNYCKTCIKYFELKDLEDSCLWQKEPDDDTMFDPMQMVDENIECASTKANIDDTEYKDARYTLDSFMRK